jgi:hypothetical protein
MPQFRTARMTEFGSNSIPRTARCGGVRSKIGLSWNSDVSKHHHERVLMAQCTRSARSYRMHANRRIADRRA